MFAFGTRCRANRPFRRVSDVLTPQRARRVPFGAVTESEPHPTRTAGLALGALGIVFGDIGTSPLYALRESFEHADLDVTRDSAYGVASVVFWALVLVISVKYLLTVMRADNHGEGGILALTALVIPSHERGGTVKRAIITLGVFGTALLYGDGLITPAISVLSAVEGFEVASSAFADWVVPIAVAILGGLFLVQRRGTAGIAQWFAPVMLVWFAVLAALGLRHIVDHAEVLRAVSPHYALAFFVDQPLHAFISLGSIFLVVTGGEALYADMGHFGRRPIVWAWYAVVFPALLLTYFGQAAFLATRPGEEVGNVFFRMAPEWAVIPLAVLATFATIIASQALITGVFSLTAQAVQLDYLPRVAIRHTSSSHRGQIYVPAVNWLLMIGCMGLVIGFGSSTDLAAAYGLAVTGTMAITTLLLYRVMLDHWQWSQATALAVSVPLLLVDLAFLGANLLKLVDGGWFPLVIGLVLVTLMTTWRRGRALVAVALRRGRRTVAEAVEAGLAGGVIRVPGAAVFMFKDPGSAPPALEANLRHNHALHRTTLVVSVLTTEAPRVPPEQRLEVSEVVRGVYGVVVRYGYMDTPDVVEALGQLRLDGEPFDASSATYFLGREAVSSLKEGGMARWRERLFAQMNRSAASAARFYQVPGDRVLEVGSQVDI